MFDLANPIIWLIALVSLATVFVLWRGGFGPEVRERRRRERSHGRVVSKARRPMVRLAVKSKPEGGR
jgi:hypothetical protein